MINIRKNKLIIFHHIIHVLIIIQLMVQKFNVYYYQSSGLQLGKNSNECQPWTAPNLKKYNKFIEQQQALNTYKKNMGKIVNYHQIYKK